MSGPSKVIMRAFNVGFGDCFLLSFVYAQRERHVLIDFGTFEGPKDAASGHMLRVANEIAKLTNGALDILVATHRHKDHINGFDPGKSNKGPGAIIRKLNPALVLQPWTEEPDIATDATGPALAARALLNMQSVAADVASFAKSVSLKHAEKLGFSKVEMRHLGFVGENNIRNVAAVKNLMTMGKARKYIHADMKLSLSKLLPGVAVTVMGPPTVQQHAEVAKQREDVAGEYWLHAARTNAGKFSANGSPFVKFARRVPHHAKWLRQRMLADQKTKLLGIVRDLDKQMNNTSLILHFKVGSKSLLFPGDAQWENWQYALSKEKYRALLKDVDLYKVGHHGSRNATPHSLWNLFEKRTESKTAATRLVTVMSTKHNVHGDSEETAVPRSTLVEALEHDSHHHSTEAIKKGTLYSEIVLDCT
jgi:hypothetical protein